MSSVRLEGAKKVITKDHSGNENGYLIELFKDKQTGNRTEVYLTVSRPGTFKGYHLHRVREARYFCLKGRVKIITYEREGSEWVRAENILDATTLQRFYIPKNIATGLETIGEEEAFIINYPDPAYDPLLKDEQVEYTEEELKNGVLK